MALAKLTCCPYVNVFANREVEAANPAAVNLYRKFGFEERENPNKLSRNLFMFKKV